MQDSTRSSLLLGAAVGSAATLLLAWLVRRAERASKTGGALTAETLRDTLGLDPHPEGGYYRRTYASELRVQTSYGERCASTAIHFVVTRECVSRLHRLEADELWHFYGGGPLIVLEIDVRGQLTKTRLSPARPQHAVPAGNWFGSYPDEGTAVSWVGCTVAPGFEFEDFELGSCAALVAQFPQHAADIRRLTIGLP